MVSNFTVHHDHAFKSCPTRWPLIGLRNLILIGQLRIWWKQTKAFFHTLADVNNLNTECHSKQKMKTKVANSVCYRICQLSYTECIIIVWFDSKFFTFDFENLLQWCKFQIRHSIIQSIKTLPIGQWESRCLGQ